MRITCLAARHGWRYCAREVDVGGVDCEKWPWSGNGGRGAVSMPPVVFVLTLSALKSMFLFALNDSWMILQVKQVTVRFPGFNVAFGTPISLSPSRGLLGIYYCNSVIVQLVEQGSERREARYGNNSADRVVFSLLTVFILTFFCFFFRTFTSNPQL